MMSLNRDVFAIVGLATCVKILLVWTYRSTDFEVHRNWLAITYSLPLKDWYYEARSEWTLDYPPLFAWFEWALSQVAVHVDPLMLKVDNLNYASQKTILFQRFSVIVSDLVLIYAAWIWHGICYPLTRNLPRLFQPLVLVGLIMNPGLFIVDHIHFQYNGILMGLMLLSMARIYQGHVLWGSFWFCVLLNMKHIYLYIAPPFFVYLLSSYILSAFSWELKIKRLSWLAAIVVSVFAVSFGPFLIHGQLGQIASRLFPLKRGLVHAYWAPNLWAFYAGADKVVGIVASKLGFQVGENSLAKGLVQEANFAVFPNIPSLVTMVLALILMGPFLLRLYRKPTPGEFLINVVYSGLISFMVGYHVHEKAILIPLLGMLPLALWSAGIGSVFVIFSTLGHFALFPLIFTAEERFIKAVLTFLYAVYMNNGLAALHKREPLSKMGRYYLFGLFLLFGYAEMVWEVITPRLEFLPLMLTSLYCAFGIVCATICFAFLADRNLVPTAKNE